MNVYLSDPLLEVNAQSENFSDFCEDLLCVDKYRQSNPSRKSDATSALTLAEQHEASDPFANCRQRSGMSTSKALRIFIAHGPDQTR